MSDYVGHFCLWGDFEIEQVTDLLKMQPSKVFRKGETLEGASAPATVSSWDFYCPPDTGKSMGEQISVLLDILWPKSDALKSLTSKFHADLNVVSSCAGGTTVLNLDHEILQKLVELNLNLNCFYECDGGANAN